MKYLLLLIFIFFNTIGCADILRPIKDEEAIQIAVKKLHAIPNIEGVDINKLPKPTIEYGEKWMNVDFKDDNQNIWFVVTVYPDKTSEVSFTKIN